MILVAFPLAMIGRALRLEGTQERIAALHFACLRRFWQHLRVANGVKIA